MVVWVSHARVGHRQGFIPEAPSKRWGLLLCTDTPCVHRRRLNATGRQLPGAGWSSLAARRAHNPKVAGSNPAPATNMYPQAAAPRGRRFALGKPEADWRGPGEGRWSCGGWRVAQAPWGLLRLKVRSQAGEQPSATGVRTCEQPWMLATWPHAAG